jgi:hypothetical protein
MSTLARAVHRGGDGSVHYLSSADDGSTLIIADPALGKAVPIRLDGPCRLRSRTDDGRVEYEAIGTVYSTLVVVSPGSPPLISEYGFCSSCMTLPSHDYELWPVCPSEGVKQRVNGRPTEKGAPNGATFPGPELAQSAQPGSSVPLGTYLTPVPERAHDVEDSE